MYLNDCVIPLGKCTGDVQSETEHQLQLSLCVINSLQASVWQTHSEIEDLYRGFELATISATEHHMPQWVHTHGVCEDLGNRCYFPPPIL